jgi:tetratricopeptide (TPR) repeat protein
MKEVEGPRARRRWFRSATFVLAAILVLGATVYATWRNGLWVRLVGRSPASSSALQQGLDAYKHKDWGLAAERARARLAEAPGDRAAIRLLARASARLQRDGPAEALFHRVESMWESEDYNLIGRLLARKGELEMADDAWRMSVNSDPHRAEALASLVDVSIKRDQLEEAKTFAEKLATLTDWRVRALVSLADIRARLGDPAAAVDALRKALGNDPASMSVSRGERTVARDDEPLGLPGDVDLSKRLARSLLRLGRASEARQILLGSVATGDRDEEVFWLMSRAALQLGLMSEASEAIAKGGGYRAGHPFEPEPAVFVGSARCAECHKAIARAAAEARHARTFATTSELEDLVLPPNEVTDSHDSRASHHLRRDGDTLRMETQVGGQTFRAFVEYAIGSGDRGLSLLGRDQQSRLRELRISRYGNIEPLGGWDVTTGHRPRPEAIDDYLGRPLSADKSRGCFLCHTTDAHSKASGMGPAARDRAIGCERCHGPGGNHVAAVKAGFEDLAVAGEPDRAPAAAVIGLCGECHSPRGTMTVSQDDPFSVRFQATTLTWSRCYTASQSLSCVTCHDPHRDASPDPAHYEDKCLACHASDSRKKNRPEPAARNCPVNPSRGCVKCHMPVVKSTRIPHTPFTDHMIRVHVDSDPNPK